MSETAYWKCACPHCAGHIEFPAEAAGMKVACPHCGWEVTLERPPDRPRESSSATRELEAKANGSRAMLFMLLAAVALVAVVAAGGLFAWRKLQAQRTTTSQTLKVETPNRKQSVSAKLTPALPAEKINSVALPSTSSPPSDGAIASNELRVTDITLEKSQEKNSSLLYVTGTVRNEADRQRFGVKVEFDLFDRSDKKLGTAKDYLSVLEPRKEWRFKALVLDAKSTRAKLSSIKEDQ